VILMYVVERYGLAHYMPGRLIREVELQLYPYYTLVQKGVGGQHCASATLPLGRRPSTHCTGS
jgi:hypothetical protein